MPDLIYQTSPVVRFATNTFINVPTILQFDDTPLISVIKQEALGYTTEIPIYASDGTKLAKVNGTRIYLTEEGKKAGVIIDQHPQLWVCSINGRTAFEIHQEKGDAFRMQAELHTPEGYFVRLADEFKAGLFTPSGQGFAIGSTLFHENIIQNSRIGILLRSDGRVSMGA